MSGALWLPAPDKTHRLRYGVSGRCSWDENIRIEVHNGKAYRIPAWIYDHPLRSPTIAGYMRMLFWRTYHRLRGWT